MALTDQRFEPERVTLTGEEDRPRNSNVLRGPSIEQDAPGQNVTALYDNDFFGEATGGSTNLSLSATEAADAASFSVNVNVQLAATEAADTASFRTTAHFQLSATEAADTAAFVTTVNATLSATESQDSATFAVNQTVSLSATEAADAFASTVTENLLLAATEALDTASFAFEAGVSDIEVSFVATEAADTLSFTLQPSEEEHPTYGGGYTKRRREALRLRKRDWFYELPYFIELVEEVKAQPERYDEKEFKKAVVDLRALLKEAAIEAEERKKLESLLNTIRAIIKAAQEYELAEAERLEVEKKRNQTVVMLYMEQRRNRLRRLL